MKKIVLVLLLLQFALSSSAQSLFCKSYYISTSKLDFTKSFDRIINLSSKRKMQSHFYKGRNLEQKKEIKVILHGLGKSSKDLNHLIEKAQKLGDSVLVVDLHGFGETSGLNNNYQRFTKIPFEYNRDDVLEILKSIDPKYKIKLIGHSYGGGIALSALERLQKEKTELNFSKIILLSPFVKSIDKYFQDSSLTGQNFQVAIDYLNPMLKQFGIPSFYLETVDQWNNFFLFTSNAMAQQIRDSLISMNPLLSPIRENINSVPNYMANMILAPYHILANSEVSDIAYWQSHPLEFPRLLFNNILVINGIRDLNYLDYSQSLKLPKDVAIKVVHAQNDSVNPNTVTQEFQNRLLKQGYRVESISLYDENHYYLYTPITEKLYHQLTD